MTLRTYVDRPTMSRAAARHAGRSLRTAIGESGRARIIAATGASQFDFLDALTQEPGIDWTDVEMFHLDEYVGLPASHPASFRRYLRERLVNKTGMTRYHLLDVDRDADAVAERIGRELTEAPVDIAFVGIGENGHLAFNDPPADFVTERPYLIVTLDEACRRQQVGEGWFASVADVPSRAVSMSIRQILKSREIICVVPDARKAGAVRACFDGDVSPLAPASILRTHANTSVYLDRDSAALLPPAIRGEILADDAR
jgi:glucosamine-6-phosphate deaminase